MPSQETELPVVASILKDVLLRQYEGDRKRLSAALGMSVSNFDHALQRVVNNVEAPAFTRKLLQLIEEEGFDLGPALLKHMGMEHFGLMEICVTGQGNDTIVFEKTTGFDRYIYVVADIGDIYAKRLRQTLCNTKRQGYTCPFYDSKKGTCPCELFASYCRDVVKIMLNAKQSHGGSINKHTD